MLELRISNDKRIIPGTARYMAMLAESFGVPAERSSMVCFLLETILEKRMDALDSQNPYITVGMEESFREIMISVTDRGNPYVLTENQKKMFRRGLADRFSLEQLGAGGEKLTICFDHVYTERQEPEKEEIILLDRSVSCRRTGTSDEEIIEAIRCIYTEYGYEYLHPQIFQIDNFRDRLISGKYISMLCSNEHGQILGHAAIDELDEFPGLMEHCNLVVKPYARGLGAAGRLTEEILREGASAKKSGVFSRPNMAHQATQKILNKNGFVPCAMDFNGVWFSESYGTDRDSWAYAVFIIDTETEHALYLPDECREFITDVFERAGMNFRLKESGGIIQDSSVVSWSVIPSGKYLDVMITSIGADIEERLKEIAEQEEMYSVKTTLYYINMNDPGCMECYDMFRSKGYIFTGCLPGSTAGDFIIMEDLKGNPIDTPRLDPAPGYREMLDKLFAIME